MLAATGTEMTMAASSTSLNSQFSAGSSGDGRSIGQIIEPDDVNASTADVDELVQHHLTRLQSENLSEVGERSEEEYISRSNCFLGVAHNFTGAQDHYGTASSTTYRRMAGRTTRTWQAVSTAPCAFSIKSRADIELIAYLLPNDLVRLYVCDIQIPTCSPSLGRK